MAEGPQREQIVTKGGRGVLDHGRVWPRVTGLWNLQRVLVVSLVSLRVPLPCGPACCSLWPCWALSLPATLVSAPHSPACSQGHPGDTLSPCYPRAMPTPLMPHATCLGLAVGGGGTDPWYQPSPSSALQPPASPRGSLLVRIPSCATPW